MRLVGVPWACSEILLLPPHPMPPIEIITLAKNGLQSTSDKGVRVKIGGTKDLPVKRRPSGHDGVG